MDQFQQPRNHQPRQQLPPARQVAEAAGSRKRKSRKSLEREKLEKTFKEKGFLIQTQQLESAEGATYCKFRQLRKFTRYLFRSWKDYLPGSVRDPTAGPADAEGAGDDPASGYFAGDNHFQPPAGIEEEEEAALEPMEETDGDLP